MILPVFSPSYNHQVFKTIVGLNAVDVMHYFGELKFTTQIFLHNKPMLILSLASTSELTQVATLRNTYSALPAWVFLSWLTPTPIKIARHTLGMALNTAFFFVVVWPAFSTLFKRFTAINAWLEFIHNSILPQNPCEENMSVRLTK